MPRIEVWKRLPVWPGQPRQPDGQTFPYLDATLIFGIGRPHFADISAAHIVLPHSAVGQGTPLALEAIGIAFLTRSPEIKYCLAFGDRALQQMPVHEHVAIQMIRCSKRTGTWHLRHTAPMDQNGSSDRMPLMARD